MKPVTPSTILAVVGLLGLVVLAVMNRPSVKPVVLDPERIDMVSVVSGRQLEYLRTNRPGETHAEAAQQANDVYEIIARHIPNPTPDEIAIAQKYYDQLHWYVETWSEPFNDMKKQEVIASNAEDQFTRDRLLFEIKSRREFNIKHFSAVANDVHEKDRVFLRAKGFSDQLITDLQATIKYPWEE